MCRFQCRKSKLTITGKWLNNHHSYHHIKMSLLMQMAHFSDLPVVSSPHCQAVIGALITDCPLLACLDKLCLFVSSRFACMLQHSWVVFTVNTGDAANEYGGPLKGYSHQLWLRRRQYMGGWSLKFRFKREELYSRCRGFRSPQIKINGSLREANQFLCLSRNSITTSDYTHANTHKHHATECFAVSTPRLIS